MSTELKYSIIKTEDQYYKYCDVLEELVFNENVSNEDEIELLTLLIEKWDKENYEAPTSDPIQILKSLMKDHQLKAKDLAEILKLSKGTVSKILNYQTGLSKGTIRILSNYFKLRQEAFNRPYKLKVPTNKEITNAAYKNTKKKIKQTA
ncbi:helix-turn-helix domain-containing protein [Portibacter lacus]|nr:ArsR family transcriptional regulator [Portibacter lacus]